MAELLQENWVLLAIALVIGLLVAWWIFAINRKTTVERTGDEEQVGAAKRNQALIDAPPAATKAPSPEPAAVPVSEATPDPVPVAPATPAPAVTPETATADDLSQIKGLGPKLKAQLAEMGITTFAQIAAWDEAEIDRVDAQLGRFQGRIRRDNWVEQAKLLMAGDRSAYEDRFGRT